MNRIEKETLLEEFEHLCRSNTTTPVEPGPESELETQPTVSIEFVLDLLDEMLPESYVPMDRLRQVYPDADKRFPEPL